MKGMKAVLFTLLLCLPWALAQDENPCTKDTKVYNQSGFDHDDFAESGGIVFGDSLSPDAGTIIDTENLVFPSDQPLFADYLSEGAGASHLFGFFFFDIDSDGDGRPDFYEICDDCDLDGDGLKNNVDPDDDNDGITDASDKWDHASLGLSSADQDMPAELFRRGTEAAAAGDHANDYWQFVPNNEVTVGSVDVFEHPGAFLYIDKNSNSIPDILETVNITAVAQNPAVPAYCVQRGYFGRYINQAGNYPGMLGTHFFSGTGRYNWTGSTIYYIADDDGGTGQTSLYHQHSPYGATFGDIYGTANGWPDYNLYGTTDVTSSLIPESLKQNDARGEALWRYRWYEGTVSGGREFVFFLVVFYNNGDSGQGTVSNVHTYYSKSGFNRDRPISSNWSRNGNTTGDRFGGVASSSNWYPNFRNVTDHNTLANAVFGQPWSAIASSPTDDTDPVAINPDNQEWVDKWQNWNGKSKILQYRGLADWFHSTPIDVDEIMDERYGIDMSAEGDSSLIRAINGNFAHMMVGAPAQVPDAWLLGWEDLAHGGDRDYEDVVFYVRRKAEGSAVSNDVAEALDDIEGAYLTSVTFHFEDNFTDAFWGIPGTYINYFYALEEGADWIPLLGGEHLRDPDLFTSLGTTTVDGGTVTRDVTINLANTGKKDIFWKVEIYTADVNVIVPEVEVANVSYEALIHDFFYNSAALPSSNVEYFGSFETPNYDWLELGKNRGHLYALKLFNHGNPPTLVSEDIVSPELFPTTHPPAPYLWDAGVAMLGQVDVSSSTRKIYTFTKPDQSLPYSNALTRHELPIGTSLPLEVINALELSPLKTDGVLIDNFHDPGADVLDADQASQWLVAWIHGYHGIVASVVDPGFKREWVLGGINRVGPMIIRSPGVPSWLSGTQVASSFKNSFIEFIKNNRNQPTRVIMGSEAGMIHSFDAGTWISKPAGTGFLEADGHYKDDNYGTGQERWAMLPGNLLNDIKFNYTGRNSVSALIDTTGIFAYIFNGTWRRVGVFAQGQNGGTFDGRVGNVVWALDLTDPDNPTPMWEYSHDKMHNILYPLAMGWSEWDGGHRWVVASATGSSPIPGEKPAAVFLDALSGAELDVVEIGEAGQVIAGAPAMPDTKGGGYSTFAYVATSGGKLVAISLEDRSMDQVEVSNAKFFLTPNVASSSGGKVLVVAISGDNPLYRDEAPDAQNHIHVYEHDTLTRTWISVGSFALPAKHKAFARPRLVGNSLVVATTTGDTYSFCDPDPDDPGYLLKIDDVMDIAGLNPSTPGVGWDYFRNGGGDIIKESFKAPITVVNGVIRAPKSTHNSGPGGDDATMNQRKKVNAPEPKFITSAQVFGVVGWDEPLLDGRDF